MNKFKIFTAVILFSFVFFSCKKVEEAIETSKDVQMAQDNAESEEYSDEVSTMADDAYNNGKLTVRGESGGSAILGDTVKITKVGNVLTIDFGTNGITSTKDGKTRKGKIIITFNGGYKTVGASVVHTFDNYYVNNHNIAGTRTITYKGLDSNSNDYWTIDAALTITRSNGKISTWNSTRTRTRTTGGSTATWSDDEYSITGSANGVTTKGDTYTMNITTPLLVKVGCRYIQNGLISFTRGTSNATIDYGYGGTSSSCENSALVTYNGTTKVITL